MTAVIFCPSKSGLSLVSDINVSVNGSSDFNESFRVNGYKGFKGSYDSNDSIYSSGINSTGLPACMVQLSATGQAYPIVASDPMAPMATVTIVSAGSIGTMDLSAIMPITGMARTANSRMRLAEIKIDNLTRHSNTHLLL